MKEKNRFSHLLKHLMAVANLKNYVLAKELQYDESYISKWITGSLLPTEKNSEKVFRDISRCIVASCTPENLGVLYSEYQVDQNRDLEDAIFDNLVAEFDYVIHLKESTGSEVADKTAYYPELTLAQFLKKMRHPVLRQVKSLDVMMATDILALDRHYQMALAELEHNENVNVTQRYYPGVRFTMMINLDSPEENNIYNVQFLQNLLTNLSNVDFHLHSIPQSQGKLLFTVKDAYAISGMIMDENHCLSVTTTEEAKNVNALYERLQSLCRQETLAVRRTTMEHMLQSNEYMHFSFSRGQRWCISHVTEHFLPDDVFTELADQFCQKHKDVDRATLDQAHRFAGKVLETIDSQFLISEDGMNHFVVTGRVDFWGDKMELSPAQRARCLAHAQYLAQTNSNMHLRILRKPSSARLQNIPQPMLHLSDSFSYMRIHRSGPSYNISILSHPKLRSMFRRYFDTIWDDGNYVYLDAGSPKDLMQYWMQMVQVQILTEEGKKN